MTGIALVVVAVGGFLTAIGLVRLQRRVFALEDRVHDVDVSTEREVGGYVGQTAILRCSCGGMPNHLHKMFSGWALVCTVCSACTKLHPTADSVHAAWNRGETPFTWMLPGPPPWESS